MASNEIEILDPAATVGTLKKIAAGRKLNRRNFVAALGMSGAAAGAELMSGCSTSTSPVSITAVGTNGINALNFALNLAYLEATFYSFVTQGTDLSPSLTLNTGAITGYPSAKITFTGSAAAQITDLVNEIYYDEKNHVSTLLNVLGSSAVPRPAINLAAFGAIVAGAPAAGQISALSFARAVEDLGVTAYAGLLSSLVSSNVTFLGQLLGDESFHAGALRLISIQNPSIAPYAALDLRDVPPDDLGSAANEAKGPTAAGGFFATAGSSTASSTTPAGFAFTRTTSQVLAISYGGPGVLAAAGTKSGGIFPSGVNGSINTV